MCAGEHHVNEHQCGVTGCGKGRGKLCIHVVARCANCNGNHQENSAQCPSRYKAKIQAHKKRQIGDDAPQAFRSDVNNKANDRASTEPEETSPGLANSDLDMEIDNEKEKSAQKPEENLDLMIERDNWAASHTSSLSPYEENKSLDFANRWD